MSKKLKSTSNNVTGEPMPGKGLLNDPGRRLPFIVSPEAYDFVSDFSEEEKRIGKELLSYQLADPEGVKQNPEHTAVQKRNPTWMFRWDPELFAREMSDYDVMLRLVVGITNEELTEATDEEGLKINDPDIRHRYHTAMLMVAKLAHEYQDEWLLRLMSTTPWTLTKEQYCLLGHPQSTVWNDADRLTLKFTEGTIRRTMTDELFAHAEAVWGRKQLIRYAKWLTHYVGLNMFVMLDVSDAERVG